MWIALPFARSLTGRFVRAAGATALAGAALVTVAALVEGHGPRATALRVVVGPLAGIFGACWTIGAWRRARADVAAAALGWRPGGVASGLLLLALPLLMLGPQPDGRGPAMAVGPTQIEAQLPDGPARWTWTGDGVIRQAGGRTAQLPPLPRPAPAPIPPPTGRWLDVALRAAALASMLALLSRGRAPGPPQVLVAATVAFVAGQGAAWLVG